MKFFSLILLATLGLHANAQTSSSNTVTRIVAPYAAGGTADFLARQFAEKLKGTLGNVLIENRAGANGMVGAQFVSRAPTDGSTLLMPGPSVVVINPHVYNTPGFDPLNDLTPVANMTVSASALFIAATHPANDVKEFLAWARAQNRPMRFGSAGTGGVSHIWIELFGTATKMETMHIPYKGVSQATTDVIGGQIDGQFSDVAPHIPLVKGGRLKMIGLVGPQRNPALPNIPTFAEQGYPGIDGISRYGIFAPAKTPPAVVNKIAEAVAKSLEDPKFVQQLAEYGMAASFLGPPEFAKLLKADSEWWGKVVSTYKIKNE